MGLPSKGGATVRRPQASTKHLKRRWAFNKKTFQDNYARNLNQGVGSGHAQFYTLLGLPFCRSLHNQPIHSTLHPFRSPSIQKPQQPIYPVIRLGIFLEVKTARVILITSPIGFDGCKDMRMSLPKCLMAVNES